ncbi:uncharacterized protein TRAVEDRAFT_26653 [Trametes versicolor FP-101664 SS1]|uniref:uncharacterized protein n=1 Tax=Trametes versicolor (strain FP-101664) TaxID=717944 RepID=UPI00046227AF|nr:uncharacterized protein TRAVEDRAFT_26653 [Trametes versicolor FP-101664 SS1]EIW63341.1 hypothetical protein TRAVEDRAFT_26653 [Trametes versicolor FP-101664 SS1]
MSTSTLARFLSENYGAIKARYPGAGRRRWRLAVAELFWALPAEQKALISQNPLLADTIEEADFNTDDDPADGISDDAPGLGVLLRADYTDEGAWAAFYAKLQEAEAEFAADASQDAQADTHGEAPSAAQGAASSSTDAGGDTAMVDEVEDADADADADANDADDDDDDGGAPIFAVINAATPAEQARFSGLSNIAALRLFNDVDVRRAPAPPQGTRRIKPPNRLVDHDGWQEIYSGKTVWVYDARSNQDQCVRLVSQASAAMYGTATADSWRARVGHICELQVNLAAGALSIDFGGLDRWDYDERARNLREALQLSQ